MPIQPTILHIAIHKPVRHCFDYLLPSHIDPALLQPGMRVLAPFGTKQMLGIIIKMDQSPCFDLAKMKPIHAVLDTDTFIPPTLFSLYEWASQYYQHPIGEVILGTLPALLRDKKTHDNKICYYQLTSKGLTASVDLFKRSPKQRALFQQLQNDRLSKSMIKQLGFSETILTALLEKEIIEPFWEIPALENLTPSASAEKPHTLNADQQIAVDAVTHCHSFKTFLLEGITGSGKTEVYLQIIDHILKQNRQALILIPEIGLTPQTIARFQRRFPVCIVTFHSKLTPNERLTHWMKAQTGEARIIIGTRSSIFIPATHLGVIILDEEHDASFKQQSGFRYSARDLAIIRAQMEKIPVVLGTATPSLETFYNAEMKRFHRLSLPFRTQTAQLPVFHILDIRNQPMEEGLSPTLLNAIRTHLDNHNQILLFLNRRGFAPIFLCHQCGWSATCRRCDAKLTFHQSPPKLVCHHCQLTLKLPTHCESCQGNHLWHLGMGTQKIEIALQKYFPNTDIFRIDRDTIRHKRAFENMLDTIKHGQKQILIGTQMLAKGHHFPNVTMVGILDIDSGFYSTDFRAIEFTGQLITQVAGRAGRAEKPGEVFLQTHEPEHPLLKTLVEKGYYAFAKNLLDERQIAHWPPFSFLTLLRAEATDKNKPLQFLSAVKKMSERTLPAHIQLLGPIPAPMQKKAGFFRAMLLIQSPHRKKLQHWLASFISSVEQLKLSQSIRWSVDVDPMEMF